MEEEFPLSEGETSGDYKGLMSFSGLGTISGYVILGRLLWAYPTSLSQPLALSVSIPVTLISLLSPAHNTHLPDTPLAHASPLCQEANGIFSLRPLLATPSKMAAFFPATPLVCFPAHIYCSMTHLFFISWLCNCFLQ